MRNIGLTPIRPPGLACLASLGARWAGAFHDRGQFWPNTSQSCPRSCVRSCQASWMPRSRRSSSLRFSFFDPERAWSAAPLMPQMPWRAAVTPGTSPVTPSYDVAAPAMQLRRHEGGIHVVRSVTGEAGVMEARFYRTRPPAPRAPRPAPRDPRSAIRDPTRDSAPPQPASCPEPAADAARSASQTRRGDAGMSMCRTPRCATASTIAFCTAGVEPIVPASPIPLAPSGL